MNERREAEELVRLWQELQEAQVAGDAERLAGLQRRAESESKRPDASEEWQQLEQEAGRYGDRLLEALEEQPSVGVGDGTETVPVDVESAPEPVEGRRGRGRTGSLIWLAILVGWVVLQILQGLGGENGSP
ncbi:MAG TPA: hypothetical protein VNP93_13825 [Gaiellaceae bacterium]|nr:hypothetical protein [Gaiellaceae bacterium]